MVDRILPLQQAIQSCDAREIEAAVVRVAEAARRDEQTVERLIVELKRAVDSLPASAFRDRARVELRDAIVRIAIGAYYDRSDGYQRPSREQHTS
ncbi:MAG: hypothetical protein ACT4PJ_13160 [Gemmatimonadaceae bacterium]